MVTWRQVIERYGEEMAEKMIATGLLDAITCVMLPSGGGHYLTFKVGPVNTRPEERGQLPREWTSVSPQYVVDVPN